VPPIWPAPPQLFRVNEAGRPALSATELGPRTTRWPANSAA